MRMWGRLVKISTTSCPSASKSIGWEGGRISKKKGLARGKELPNLSPRAEKGLSAVQNSSYLTGGWQAGTFRYTGTKP